MPTLPMPPCPAPTGQRQPLNTLSLADFRTMTTQYGVPAGPVLDAWYHQRYRPTAVVILWQSLPGTPESPPLRKCARCSRPARPGKVECARCQRRKGRAQSNRYHAALKAGLCPVCRLGPPDDPAFTICSPCRFRVTKCRTQAKARQLFPFTALAQS